MMRSLRHIKTWLVLAACLSLLVLTHNLLTVQLSRLFVQTSPAGASEQTDTTGAGNVSSVSFKMTFINSSQRTGSVDREIPGESAHKNRQDRNEESRDQEFHQIDQVKAWVYSAFYEAETGARAVVRVLGVALREGKPAIVCCYKTLNGSEAVYPGKRDFMKGSHQKRFVPVIYECEADVNIKPVTVSLTYSLNETRRNYVKIQYPQKRERNFTVCYPALFGYNNISRIIQAIEINRVLGAQHFFIYNYSISREMDAVLRHYQDEGVLTVLQWPLPLDDVMDVWYYGQMSAINDCVYRNKFVSQYVVIQDPDEFIIPNHHMTWAELIEAAELEYLNQPYTTFHPLGSFYFQSAYFSDKQGAKLQNVSITADDERFLRQYSVFPLTHLHRQITVFKFPKRSKAIVRPDHIHLSGIHFTHVHRGSATYTVVSNQLAVVHHYQMPVQASVLDFSVLRFKDTVLPPLREAFGKFTHLFRNDPIEKLQNISNVHVVPDDLLPALQRYGRTQNVSG